MSPAQVLAQQRARRSFGQQALGTLKGIGGALGGAYEWLRDSPVIRMSGGQNPIEMFVEPVRVAGRRAVGDATAIPGVGADSPSYTAQEIRDEGVVPGVLKAGLDYGTLAATAAGAAGAARNAIPKYGVHVSPTSGLTEISPRAVGAGQTTAADAMVGSSYMWDARSPRMMGNVFENPQMSGLAGMGEEPALYVTRARGRVFQDANVPNTPALRVAGPQEVIGELPFTREALLNFLESRGISPRSATADRIVTTIRNLSPTVRADVANRPAQLAEERLRAAIRLGRQGGSSNRWSTLAGLDENAPLRQLLSDPNAKNFFDQFMGMS
jgi:hypothetical protein